MYVQDIKPSMVIFPLEQSPSFPFTVVRVEYVHGYTGRYIVHTVDNSGRRRKFYFNAGEQVPALA